MKAELHLHTSRHSLCAANTPEEMMNGLIQAGYEAVFITEHDAVWADDELESLRDQFPALAIFPGVELTVGLHHLLVLGTNDASYLGTSDEAEILARAAGENCLTALAHPFRWEGGSKMLSRVPLPDAIEDRTCNHEAAAAIWASAASRELGLRLVNAGDAHSLEMIGRFWIETHAAFRDAGEIREIILRGAYDNCTGGQ